MSSTGRGHLRIYLGAAPGVGKTYKMLGEGQRRRARGTDVVVGFVETHGREHTAAMLDGLEVVPRKILDHRGASFTEMDLDAVLARRPEVALVDELAHSNVPGSRNAKRWEDIDELLAAGIDVISAVNIQHLESINDVVEKITGVPQQETVPDRVVRAANQIELVDMTPEALRRRMAHGNVYAADKIDAALGNYFRVGNLSALRELALLWLADRVDAGLQQYRSQHDIDSTWEARERVVVALTGGPEGETLIRRAARIAARSSGGDLLAVHITRSDGLTGADPSALAEQRRLVESLGGTYHQVVGDDIPEALLSFARAENATQLVLGGSRRSWLSSLLTGPGIGANSIRDSGDIDVHIVTHSEMGRGRLPRAHGSLSRRRLVYGFALAVVLPPLLALLLGIGGDTLNLTSNVLAFLFAVVVVALVGGLWPAIADGSRGHAGTQLVLHPADSFLLDHRAEQRVGLGDLPADRGPGLVGGRPRGPAYEAGCAVRGRVRDPRNAGRIGTPRRNRAAGSARTGPRGLRDELCRPDGTLGDRRTDRDLATTRLSRYADLPAARGRRRRDPGPRRPGTGSARPIAGRGRTPAGRRLRRPCRSPGRQGATQRSRRRGETIGRGRQTPYCATPCRRA